MKNYYRDAKIICIEPDPENFDILQKNVTLYQDISCENCGLWDKDTKLRVYDKHHMGKWGMVVEEDFVNGNIPAISMSTLLKKYAIDHVDILKLDIEGSEKQLFLGDCDWLIKVKTIAIELHDRMEAGCAKSFFTAINRYYSQYEFSMQGENVIIYNRCQKN